MVCLNNQFIMRHNPVEWLMPWGPGAEWGRSFPCGARTSASMPPGFLIPQHLPDGIKPLQSMLVNPVLPQGTKWTTSIASPAAFASRRGTPPAPDQLLQAKADLSCDSWAAIQQGQLFSATQASAAVPTPAASPAPVGQDVPPPVPATAPQGQPPVEAMAAPPTMAMPKDTASKGDDSAMNAWHAAMQEWKRMANKNAD